MAMKRTPVLFAQNVGRIIRFKWFTQGRIKVIPTSTEEILKSHGYDVVGIDTVLRPREEKENFEYVGLYDREIPLDENHPDYKVEPCYIYKDENVLLEGLNQAKVLTNTVEISDGLPDCLIKQEKELNLSDVVHSEIKKKIMISCMFDATQEKLPKRKDPLRPAWIFPRDYGIPDRKINELLCKNLLTVCEKYGKSLRNKSVVMNAFFSAPFEIHNKKIQFEMSSELAITTSKKLAPFAEPNITHSFSVPDIHPLDCTVSLPPYNFYVMQKIYPFSIKSKWPHVQMAVVHYNHTKVKNIFGEPVTETQIHGRSLLKGFSIAASNAYSLYGDVTKELPEPIVVPVVQTDGKMFYFSIFQLNTLELDKNSQVKNIFWNSPGISLYNTCKYLGGKPILKEYNPDVIKKLVTLYNI